ncbi:hypothetical protein [Tychonema sp. LEGE 07203]|uniref:hypothetical protein n=1 Tax=Tychonema sp. LEGE 07203 TaxID=1828671 RepID=UPI001881B006|nr:hypothetical protein [Tychonema sp. LEGE 07203]
MFDRYLFGLQNYIQTVAVEMRGGCDPFRLQLAVKPRCDRLWISLLGKFLKIKLCHSWTPDNAERKEEESSAADCVTGVTDGSPKKEGRRSSYIVFLSLKHHN